MEKRIDVFHTHIEVSPYTKGEYFELEKALSRWEQKTKKFGKYEPVAYFINNETLYLPKGINIEILENKFGCKATINYNFGIKEQKMSNKYDVLLPPKDEIQDESVKFLTSSEEFRGTAPFCQYTLNLETSGGKTYCAINSFTKMGVKTLVIVNREYLSSHWKSEVMHFTNIPEDRIIQVDGSTIPKILEAEIEGDVYIMMHQTIQTYARTNGWREIDEFMRIAGIGVKIYDEAHEFISSIFLIDCFTNVKKTFYLTATFGRSNRQENKVFHLMLSSSCKFDDKSMERDKKIHYIVVNYKSNIPMKYVTGMKGAHGFSAYKFIDAAIKHDSERKILHAIRYALSEALEHDGQILLITPKKESVEFMADFVSKMVGNSRTLGTIFSNNSEEVNLQNQNCDIICSTIKSCGTGFNPPNLQTIICAEPHSSRLMTHQLKGRLDRFKGQDTYFYDILDSNIPFMDNIKGYHLKELSKFAKEMNEVYI